MAKRWIASLLLVGFLVACGPGAGAGRGTLGGIDVPSEITDDNFSEFSRVYVSLRLDHPSRTELRERLVSYLARRSADLLTEGSYDDVVGHFAELSELFSPEDMGDPSRIPGEMAPVARYVLEHGSPRGDEGGVLAALLVLRSLETEGDFDRRYRQIAAWGRDARTTYATDVERYTGLIEVWEKHAHLTPTPDVLNYLAQLHRERRDAIHVLIRRDGPAVAMAQGMSPQVLREAPSILRRAPLDVAGVFLRHGDLANAITQVEAMGDVSGIESHVLQALEDAQSGDQDALLELMEAYAEGRPDVALGLCRYGLRTEPEDAAFPLCLARIYAAAAEYPTATGWYAEAIRRDPEERELYDEALESIGTFIAREVFEADPSDARGMATAAEEILEQRVQRWPGDAPSVEPYRLHFVVGLLEMNVGNAEAAEQRFTASLQAEETVDAHLEMGRLTEGSGRHAEAAEHYRRALDLININGPEGELARSRILERLGDAFRNGEQTAQSERMYRQALEIWSQLVPQLTSIGVADGQVRRGILLSRLGRTSEATTAFREAMESGPGRREVYATILSFLVTSEPNVEFATEVFRRAMRELRLEPEWRVYFALWVETIASRAGGSASEANDVLRSHSSGDGWWGHLARFGSGDLPYSDLLEEASNVGERAEAYFYEGTRLLKSGDQVGAQRQFERVIGTHMVNFYEYTMSLELLDN